jgi:sulfur-oxidizing protein SoxY
MKRRNFLKISSVLAISTTMIPSNLFAINFRKTRAKIWSIQNNLKLGTKDLKATNVVIKKIFGTTKTIKSNVILKAPKIVENGSIVLIGVSTKLKAKTIALFQSANPEVLVAIFDIHESSIPDYVLRIRLQDSAILTAVVQTKSGKLYSASKDITVVVGGCGT